MFMSNYDIQYLQLYRIKKLGFQVQLVNNDSIAKNGKIETISK